MIYWCLVGSESVASARLQGFNVVRLLQNNGIPTRIIYFPPSFSVSPPKLFLLKSKAASFFSNRDILVIQKVNFDKALLVKIKKRGTKIIFIDCDLPLKLGPASMADIVVVPSEKLADRYREAGVKSIEVINDYPEIILKKTPFENNKFSQLRMVWFGQMSERKRNEINWLKDLIVKHPLSHKFTLDVISNKPPYNIKWEGKNTWHLISNYDAVVIPKPSPSDGDIVRSINRLVQAMALGVPVIASGIPSYETLHANGAPFILCRTEEDWRKGLGYLLNFRNRVDLARRGNKYINEQFNFHNYRRDWLALVETVAQKTTSDLQAEAGNPKSTKALTQLFNLSKAVECSNKEDRIFLLNRAQSQSRFFSRCFNLIYYSIISFYYKLYRVIILCAKKGVFVFELKRNKQLRKSAKT